jgi:hypothetical protein
MADVYVCVKCNGTEYTTSEPLRFFWSCLALKARAYHIT